MNNRPQSKFSKANDCVLRVNNIEAYNLLQATVTITQKFEYNMAVEALRGSIEMESRGVKEILIKTKSNMTM